MRAWNIPYRYGMRMNCERIRSGLTPLARPRGPSLGGPYIAIRDIQLPLYRYDRHRDRFFQKTFLLIAGHQQSVGTLFVGTYFVFLICKILCMHLCMYFHFRSKLKYDGNIDF